MRREGDRDAEYPFMTVGQAGRREVLHLSHAHKFQDLVSLIQNIPFLPSAAYGVEGSFPETDSWFQIACCHKILEYGETGE